MIVATERADEVRELGFTTFAGDLHRDAKLGREVNDSLTVRGFPERCRTDRDDRRDAVLFAGGPERREGRRDLRQLRITDSPVSCDVVAHAERPDLDASLQVPAFLE